MIVVVEGEDFVKQRGRERGGGGNGFGQGCFVIKSCSLSFVANFGMGRKKQRKEEKPLLAKLQYQHPPKGRSTEPLGVGGKCSFANCLGERSVNESIVLLGRGLSDR